jgi:hypothetical protein
MTNYHYEAEPLNEKSAASFARKWVEEQIDVPKSIYFSQMKWLMKELAQQCVRVSLQLREDEGKLEDRLGRAFNILSRIQFATTADTDRWPKSSDTPEQRKKKEGALQVFWNRHDPKRSFQEGYRSEHYAAVDRSEYEEAVAEYLVHRELRHPFIDWALLDMSISRELCAFGEEIKKTSLGKQDWLGIHRRYFKTEGNFHKMTAFDLSEFGESVLRKAFWFVGLPAGALWFVVQLGYSRVADMLLAGYACAVLASLANRLIPFCIRKIRGTPNPRLKPFQLWDEMYEVWRLLEGPVVHPTRVKEAMLKSSKQGAVWDNVSWSLIDRAVAADPAVWVVSRSG